MYNQKMIDPIEIIFSGIKKIFEEQNLHSEISVLPTERASFGDFSFNVNPAFKEMVKSGSLGEKGKDFLFKTRNTGDTTIRNTVSFARYLKDKLEKNEEVIKAIEKIEIKDSGYINFFVSVHFKSEYFKNLINNLQKLLTIDHFDKKSILIEYTDPNPFKVFHIGHLMSNAIGESLSRIYQNGGAKVRRACYQGDVGLHVAKAIYGIFKQIENFPAEASDLKTKTRFLGECYVLGSNSYEDDPSAKSEIEILNQKIYEMEDLEIKQIYDLGKKWSLDHFEEIYQVLGTKFDNYYFESETAKLGQKIVLENMENGVFIKSEGAIIFPGSDEKYGLHNRVFINSKGLPTYEAKELGLSYLKKQNHSDILKSIVITASEQIDFMRVVLSAWQEIDQENASKVKHITHGMLRFAEGKMSSRKGNVVSGEDLINKVKDVVLEKTQNQDLSIPEREEISSKIAIGAIKYSILKQSPGKDIVYDFDKSLSFEGDSGPYLQYSVVRAKSLLEKAGLTGIFPADNFLESVDVELENNLLKYPVIFKRSLAENSPNFLVTLAIETARSFNSFYGKNKIIDNENIKKSEQYLLLTKVFVVVMESILDNLAIPVPKKM